MDNNQTSLTMEIQLLQLEMLAEFRRICDKYHLRWFAIGGTCLGAVRHQGFIPWDDDIDVAMPFEDYSRFREVAEKELPESFELGDPHKERKFYFILKINNIKTTYIEPGCLDSPEKYKGIFFDIMPLFGLPVNPWKRSVCVLDHRLLLRADFLFHSEEKQLNKKRLKPHMKLLSLLISQQKHTKPFDYYQSKMELKLSKYPFEQSEYILFGWRQGKWIRPKGYTYHEVFPYADFASYTELPFENTTIRVPVGYDDYLRRDFGDYMQLPPPEKRVNHQAIGTIIDLHKSYKEYAKEYRERNPEK